ncbi:WxL domain-containing protein [Lapidilactobacillus wuchangensis]|uniref:WxL domain-containing protein n=1 Tax=Lapidilactobacillus wuchangensis TaxID=2486001 RepID=UPI000F79DC16|nr:WxL domain-containing protein [Lapidilactobacillus wuchangensis]
MKSTKLVLAAATALLGFFAVSGVNAQAADITNNTGDTTATVGLTSDSDDDKISLTKAPVFDFGSQQIGSQPLTLQAETVTDPITVENPGLGTGWNVTVTGSDFLNGSTKLNGAKLVLNGEVAAEDSENQSVAPTTKPIIVNDQAQNIFTATANNGIGGWLNNFDTDYDHQRAVLKIPAGNVAGTYVSNLTWTLTDAPVR